MSFIVNAATLAGCGERLAWQTGSDDMNSSTPRCAIEGCEIVPDRARIQPRLPHPFHENGRCVAVPLNTSHGAYSEAGECETESAVSVAEVEGMKGTYSHITTPCTGARHARHDREPSTTTPRPVSR